MEDWKKKLDAVRISKQDMNKLVMNYLVIEGFKDAAEQFALESGTSRKQFRRTHFQRT